MPYVQSLTNVLSANLGWHKARLKFMARFTIALLQMSTTNLRELAIALKAEVKEESNYRRIRRFLSEYEVNFSVLGRFLRHLLPQSAPYKVLIDRTEWYFGQGNPRFPVPVNVLMIGIAHEGVAFPISWTVLPEDGSSSASDCQEALKRFFQVVEPSQVEAVVADREFISAGWLSWLQERGVPFVIRLRSDRHVGLSPEGPSLPARMFARPLALQQVKVLESERYLHGADGEEVRVRVVLKRIADPESQDPFLILATSGTNPEEAIGIYRRRWEIETLFAALKSRGYDLERTHLTEPDRIQRLIGLLALAFGWTWLIGQRRANREGPPREKSHERRQRSLFRYGLDRLRGILATPEPQPAAFFECLRGLRNPTAFLSCT